MTTAEIHTRTAPNETDMGLTGYIYADVTKMTDAEIVEAVDAEWIKKLTVVREDGVIKIYAGNKNWFKIFP